MRQREQLMWTGAIAMWALVPLGGGPCGLKIHGPRMWCLHWLAFWDFQCGCWELISSIFFIWGSVETFAHLLFAFWWQNVAIGGAETRKKGSSLQPSDWNRMPNNMAIHWQCQSFQNKVWIGKQMRTRNLKRRGSIALWCWYGWFRKLTTKILAMTPLQPILGLVKISGSIFCVFGCYSMNILMSYDPMFNWFIIDIWWYMYVYTDRKDLSLRHCGVQTAG